MEIQTVALDRSRIIGGSDIAAVMGLSRWKTPLALWAEKTGKIDTTLANFEAKEIGTELEEYVSEKFQKKTGIRLRRDRRTFVHPVYPYMVAHIDRWVIGEDALFEAKTTSAWMAKEWAGQEIPQEYVLQCLWYLGILRKSKAYIAVLIGGNKFVWKEIAFDQEVFDKMVEAAKYFMEEFIERDVAPMAMADDNDGVLSQMFPESAPKTIQFQSAGAEEIDRLLEQRAEGIREVKAKQSQLDGFEARLKQLLGEAESGETDRFRLFWKTQSRSGVDSEQLKADGLFEKYVKATSFRVLRTSRKEGFAQSEAA